MVRMVGVKVTITVMTDSESPVVHIRAWCPLLSHFKHVENVSSVSQSTESFHTDVMGSLVKQVGSMQGLEERSPFLRKLVFKL